jgi:hypothetical protein
MKMNHTIVLALMALGTTALLVSAQDNNNDGRPPGGGGQRGPGAGGPGMGAHRLPPPIIGALDANHDGVIDATEIANASEALKTLDKNGDGKITIEEAMGPRPQNPNGQPGQGQRPGGKQGPNGPGHRLPPGPPPGEGEGNNLPPGPPPGDQ